MSLIVALVGAAAALLGLAYIGQSRLIFFPQPLSVAPPPSDRVEEIRHTSADGTRLHGWLVKAQASRAPLLIYYGGNAEEVSWMLVASTQFSGWSLLLMNYRGYGLSEGRPGEAALLSDALELYDAAAARPDVDPGRIALMGRSLGSGVAVHVAARRPVRGLVLVSPYDSLAALARRHYPFLPAAALLRHRFDSLSLAPRIGAPLMCVVASRDSIIPVEHSRRLFQAWAGPRRWHEIAGAGHNDLSERPEYWETIARFLQDLAAEAAR
jgi:pimeloyl-ACP methyl ester carboxylesterase